MTRVVYNNIYGGFSLSKEVCATLNLDFNGREISRTDPHLISLIDEFGSKYCSGKCAKLAIATIPADWDDCWKIEEYDGMECVMFDRSLWLEKRIKLVKLAYPVAGEMIDKILDKYKELCPYT